MSDPTPLETGEPAAPPTDEPAPPDRETYARPPSMLEVVLAMRPEARIFGLFEFWATWWFWHWRNTMAFRWLCEAVIVVAVFAGVAGLYWDIEARQEERIARQEERQRAEEERIVRQEERQRAEEERIARQEERQRAEEERIARQEERQEWAKGRAVDHAQLFAQIAALAKDVQFKDPANPTDVERAIAAKAGAGIGPIMTLLAREKVPMRQVNVAGVLFPRYLALSYANLRNADLIDADLTTANLVGAELRFADLLRANLREADMEGADLYHANLQGAYLYHANLQGANLQKANLSDADLRHVRNLTQEQLDTACTWEGAKPPDLDGAKDPETKKPLVWPDKICLTIMERIMERFLSQMSR